MCGIFLGPWRQNFKELLDANERRGSFSWSFTRVMQILDDMWCIKTERGFGNMPSEIVTTLTEFDSFIGHVQAPTGGLIEDENRIHPAEDGPYRLWHNGVLKAGYIEQLQKEFNTDETWDTKLLLTSLIADEKKALQETDGSFACVYMKVGEWIKIFRNPTAPFYYGQSDTRLMLSSVKTARCSIELESNRMYSIAPNEWRLTRHRKFRNRNNPFYFGD